LTPRATYHVCCSVAPGEFVFDDPFEAEELGDDTTTSWFMSPRNLQTGKPKVTITVAGIAGKQRTDSTWTCPLNRRVHLVFTFVGDGRSNQGWPGRMPARS